MRQSCSRRPTRRTPYNRFDAASKDGVGVDRSFTQVRAARAGRRRAAVAARVFFRQIRRREGRTRVAPHRDERVRRGPPDGVRGERIRTRRPARVALPRAINSRRGALHRARDGRARGGRRAPCLQGAGAGVYSVTVTACRTKLKLFEQCSFYMERHTSTVPESRTRAAIAAVPVLGSEAIEDRLFWSNRLAARL